MNEVPALFKRWLDRTIELHHNEMKRLKVVGSGDLDESIRGEYVEMSEGYLRGELYFDGHGRFVDMGSSRGWSHGRRTEKMTNRRQGKKNIRRKKKPFYSRVWYARINDLQGAVGYQLMEEVVKRQHAAMKE